MMTRIGPALCLLACVLTSRGDRLPNLIFVMADDLGYAELGSYGQTAIQTPRLDRMAAEGMRFTEVYAGSTVCAPSRSVLMTGLHTGHTTVRGNFGLEKSRVPLHSTDVTLAEILQRAGYATGMTGKWGLGEPGTTGEPNAQGFDQWFGFLNQARAHTYYPDYLWKNREKVMLPNNANGRQVTYSHDLFAEFALDFIRRHREEPFFLYLPYCLPHTAYEIPSLAPYENQDWPPDARAHAAMITRLDTAVGRMLDLLVELDLDEDTLVIFVSDNGADLRWEGQFDSCGPLRGRKRDLYEGGIRVPMIVRQPGTVPAGTTSDLPVWFPDILPTLADVAGVAAPRGLDGVSIRPTLRGEVQDPGPRRFYWEFHERGYQQAAREGPWKVVRLKADGPLELFDLDHDPGETTNLAAGHPDIIARFETYLKTARTTSRHWGPRPGS